MTSLAARERAALCDTLLVVGPDAPTLCKPWTTRELAAHVIVREGNPAALGVAIPALSGWTDRAQRSVAARPYPDLVATIRRGPPHWSPLRPGRLDTLLNTFEYFVHHEDVLRAQATWQPRQLPHDDQRVLFEGLRRRASLFLRRSPVTAVLDIEGFAQVPVGNGLPQVVVRGPVTEMVLYLHGRTSVARLEIDGPPETVNAFRRLRISV
jgi:uncharacterized protein (TIGR03085 family)